MSPRWTVTSEKFLSDEEVAALIHALRDRKDLALHRNKDPRAIRDYYVVRTLLETGLRVAELCSLRISDLQGTRLTVRRGKGGKARTVLLTRGTAALLREWLSMMAKWQTAIDPESPLFVSRLGAALTTRAIQKRVKYAYKIAGLRSNLSTHSLRHTYCVLLMRTGKVGLATIRDNLGHHSIAVTNLYAHASGDIEGVNLMPNLGLDRERDFRRNAS